MDASARLSWYCSYGDEKGGGSPQLYYHGLSGRIPGHTTRAPPPGFELETNGFQFYAIATLDKTSPRTSYGDENLEATCLKVPVQLGVLVLHGVCSHRCQEWKKRWGQRSSEGL